MTDILIKNGTVFDGKGSVGKRLDIALEKGKISAISENIPAKAVQIIDAKNRFVAPGFIDIQNHSDSYWTLFDQPDQLSLLSQGITTIIIGNCGSSLAPLLSPESIKTIQKWHNLSGVNINWASMSDFLHVLSGKQLGVNVATLVGHATLKRGLIGDQIRNLTGEEIKILEKSIKGALEQGAFGLSMGLVYAHEVNSGLEELKQSVLSLKPYNKYLSVHLRSEGKHILESVDEIISLAQSSAIPVKISHLKIRGRKNWHLFDRLMSKLEVAYHQGVKISFDVYPYDTSWSVLYTYLPKWAYEGGRKQILEGLKDKVTRRKILDYLKDQDLEFNNIVVAEAFGNDSFVGKSIKSIAQNQQVPEEEALANVISASQAQAIVFDHNLSGEHVELLCASPLGLIATDAAGYSGKNPKLVHPRCFGTMPRFLAWIREKKLLSWETAIKKLTSDPAELLKLPNLGSIEVGNRADLVIFDPQTVMDKADYQNPDLMSEGINVVIVNGKLAVSSGKLFNLSGQVLKR